jgi:hypothetical protein
MTIEEFHADRPAVATLMDGTKIKFKYYPRFQTADNISFVAGWHKGLSNVEDEAFFDTALKYLSKALSWIDFQDKDGKDIPPTYENLVKFRLDFDTIFAIHGGMTNDIEAQANFTNPVGESSSTGSTEQES